MGKGSASDAGVQASQASAQAAMLSYSLGEQQLQWAKDVWNQEQPLVTQSEQAQLAVSNADLVSLQQQQQFAAEQEAMYNQYYAPLEAAYTGQVANWASPANTALVTGQARADVASNVQQGINTAKEQLESFGVKPNDPRFAGLYIGANTMGAAGEAGAGTTAAQNLKLQQLGLEQGAINTGRNVAGSTVGMTNAATGAGQGSASGASGAAGTAQSNLSTGSSAMTAPTNWFNTGATNMGVYTNAVNAYNTAQLGYAQAAGSSIGSILGDITGMISPIKIAAGGPVAYAEGGDVTPRQGIPMPIGGTPGGPVPVHASPSMGAATDDVDAKLTAGEFVVPKDVAQWKGHEHFVKQIDKARQEHQEFKARGDIGGEPAHGIPARPTFVSRPSPIGVPMKRYA